MFPTDAWQIPPTLGWENPPTDAVANSFPQFSGIGTLLD
jgi:hypothetical protein